MDVVEVPHNIKNFDGICIGVGGGLFDDKDENQVRKEGFSASKLVAIGLNIYDRYPEAIKLIEEVNNIDNNGDTLGLGAICKDLAATMCKAEVVRIMFNIFSARIEHNYLLFHSEEVKHAYNEAKKYEINGKKVVSFSELGFCEYAPYAFWQGVDIVIYWNTVSNNVSIIANPKSGINLRKTYEKVISKEMYVNVSPEQIWYFREPNLLLNGSATEPYKTPTSLNEMQICYLLQNSI